MLVLARKLGETISINHGEILITVVEVRPGKVRLGVTAPQQIPVHRGEIEKRIVDGVPRKLPTV